MILKADLHIHVDQKRAHGINPRDLAERVHSTDLDVIAVLEHNKITARALDVEAELQRIASMTGRKAAEVIWAIEGGLRYKNGGSFEGYYHFVHLFKDRFNRQNRPENFPFKGGPELLEQYKQFYPGKTIGAHLTWLDFDGINPRLTNDPEMTEDLMGSGLFDGVDLLSGSSVAFINRTPRNRREYVEAIEGVGALADMFIRVRKKLMKEGGQLAAVATSDGHRPEVVGGVYTECEGDSISDVLAQIGKAKTKVVIEAVTPRILKGVMRRDSRMREIVSFRRLTGRQKNGRI